ncbi:MAG: MoxR family ATPase [Deltaproteobacteria bacterium]|nr:MoxR family ATPase [Deltaproteobacteria bacterium]
MMESIGSGASPAAADALARARTLRESVRGEVNKVVVGQDDVLDLILVGLLAGGHVLLEGVPGTAKTLICRAVSRSIAAEFKRIQFTPDLMPADILGTSIFDLKSQAFALTKGPIFSDLVLADEINRAPAKTQAALLEAMSEKSVSLEGTRHALPSIFTVFATQNPVESEGTYPLPEAQLDRFLLKIEVGYPKPEHEDEVLLRVHQGFDGYNLEGQGLKAVLRPEDVLAARAALQAVQIEPPVLQYLRKLITATRESPRVRLGAGPRAGVHLLLASKALAALAGRPFVTPDDIRRLTGPVLQHRLLLAPEAEIDGATAREVLSEIELAVEVPR